MQMERKRSFISWLTPQMDAAAGAMPKSAARSYIWVSHMGNRSPNTLAIFPCLLRHINRELYQRQRRQDSISMLKFIVGVASGSTIYYTTTLALIIQLYSSDFEWVFQWWLPLETSWWHFICLLIHKYGLMTYNVWNFGNSDTVWKLTKRTFCCGAWKLNPSG